MRFSPLGLFVLSAALTVAPAFAASPTCTPVPGLEDSLLTPGTVLLFGEIHGTAEAPEVFANAVCAGLDADRKVRVAVEWEPAEASAVEAFLTTEDTDTAREALLATKPWSRAYQDGRNSRAMLGLLEEIRGWARAGQPVEVVLFDQKPADGTTRDARMAGRLADLAAEAPGALLLVLTGNLHARLTPGVPWDDTFEPMGYLLAKALPDRAVRSLDLSSTGGSAWICQGGTPASCGAQELGGAGKGDSVAVRLGGDLDGGFSGVYHVGSISASPPAREASAPPTPEESAAEPSAADPGEP